MTKASYWARKCPCLGCQKCCPNWISRTQKRVTAKTFLDKVGQSSKSLTQQKSLLNIKGLYHEDGFPKVAEELW